MKNCAVILQYNAHADYFQTSPVVASRKIITSLWLKKEIPTHFMDVIVISYQHTVCCVILKCNPRYCAHCIAG